MKTLIIFLTCCTLYFHSSAQLSSAVNDENTTKEPEIIYTGPGKITLETGEVFEGEIVHSLITQNRISIKKADGNHGNIQAEGGKKFQDQ
jgi:hypothetical protein